MGVYVSDEKEEIDGGGGRERVWKGVCVCMCIS